MSELAGGLGEGRVLVLQPATPSGEGLFIALGIQQLWQKTLKEWGRPAASLLVRTTVRSLEGTTPEGFPVAVGDRGIASLTGWGGHAAEAALAQRNACRWVMASTLSAAVERTTLDASLIEARDGAPHPIAEWSFDGDLTALPEHVCGLLADASRRLGVTPRWTQACEAFDHHDPSVAALCLESLGFLSMAEESCRLRIDGVLDRLAMLATAAPRSRAVVTLVPALLGHLARLGAHDLQLAGWLRRIRQSTGALPPEWDGLLAEIARARAATSDGS